MEFFDQYQIEGFAEFISGLFALVPAGFTLGCFCGLLAFGIFKLFGLLKSMIY